MSYPSYFLIRMYPVKSENGRNIGENFVPKYSPKSMVNLVFYENKTQIRGKFHHGKGVEEHGSLRGPIVGGGTSCPDRQLKTPPRFVP